MTFEQWWKEYSIENYAKECCPEHIYKEIWDAAQSNLLSGHRDDCDIYNESFNDLVGKVPGSCDCGKE